MKNYSTIARQELKDWMTRFANVECKEVSPFYFSLSNSIAKDDELIDIAAHCKYRQPMPNLFLAAIHYLLMEENAVSELGSYYPSITTDYKKDLPFGLFKEFCLENKDAIIDIISTRIVQTNALNRCSYILPILSHYFGGKNLNIIDIGTSAGLTMNFEQYEYYFNDEYFFGNSPVKIKSEIREGEIPHFTELPKINKKIGIDQNPLDLKQTQNANWLKALIWADRIPRLKKMNAAIELAQKESTELIKAEKLNEFESIIMEQEKDIPLFVYHTHALYQFSKENRTAFRSLMDEIGSQRDLYYLAVEGHRVFDTDFNAEGVLVVLTTYKKGEKSVKLIAQTNGHANWIKWK